MIWIQPYKEKPGPIFKKFTLDFFLKYNLCIKLYKILYSNNFGQ